MGSRFSPLSSTDAENDVRLLVEWVITPSHTTTPPISNTAAAISAGNRPRMDATRPRRTHSTIAVSTNGIARYVLE